MTESSPTAARTIEQWLHCADQWLTVEDHQSPFPSVRQYEGAIAVYDEFLQIAPDNAEALQRKGEVLCLLGSALAGEGRYEEALAVCDQAMQSKAHDSQKEVAFSGRCFALSQLGRYEDVITTCDQAMAFKPITPDNCNALFIKGNALYGLGRYEEAIAVYDQILEILPPKNYGTLHNTLLNKALALRQLEHYEEVIELYDRIQPPFTRHNCEILNSKGYALQQLGRYEEALELYDRVLAIRFNDDKERTLCGKWIALCELGRYEDVTTSCDQALASKPLTPNSHSAVVSKGHALSALGRDAEAIELYDRLLEVLPHDDYGVILYKGLALDNLGRDEEAIELYDRVLALNPDCPTAVHNKKLLLRVNE